LTFLWWLDCDDDCPIDQRWRAIRATIGPDGFPLIWEIMGDDRDLCVLYVSRTLEDAAAERERPPPKRRFAAESALGATPSALIARVMDDGPMPMGPFVYLAREDARITTLLCRCSPSQFRDLPETKYFELRPLDNLRTAIKEVGGPDNLTESFFANLKSPSPCGHGGPNLSYLLRFAKPELP
ncbi:MAG TPA: hypothetical protein VNT79_11110, partial [Phycisphaerae bacterium]|nr:hypothetical protein [Phycisphaerae bacterium]